MTELRTRMVRDMTLRGFSPRTHKSSIAAVVHLARRAFDEALFATQLAGPRAEGRARVQLLDAAERERAGLEPAGEERQQVPRRQVRPVEISMMMTSTGRSRASLRPL